MINTAHKDYTIKPTLTVHNFVHTHTHTALTCAMTGLSRLVVVAIAVYLSPSFCALRRL